MGLETLKREIAELDYDGAVAYCGYDEDFYAEMLVEYATNGRYEKLSELYEKRDWGLYKIEVHALKGNSRMMGFPQLGDMCEELQQAAQNEDEAILLTKHNVMMENYARYIEIIRRELI